MYACDFGPSYAGVAVGVTEYNSSGIVVPRTTSGIVHIANGFYSRDFTPNSATTILVWDYDGVTATEVLETNVDLSGLESKVNAIWWSVI